MDKARCRKEWFALLDANDEMAACYLEKAQAFVRRYPKHSGGRLILAKALGYLSRFAEAEQALKLASDGFQKGNLWILAQSWGKLYNQKQDLARSEKWYRKATELKPCTTTCIFHGTVLAELGRFKEAKAEYRRAIRLAKDPKMEAKDEAYLNLGLIYRAEQKYAIAVKMFKEAIRIDPKYTVARRALKDVQEAMKLRASGGNRKGRIEG